MRKLLLVSIVATFAISACGETTTAKAPVEAATPATQMVKVTDENFIRADSNEQFAKVHNSFSLPPDIFLNIYVARHNHHFFGY